MDEKTHIDKLADRDFAQEVWEREMFSNPLRVWSAADRMRYWMQPKRLKVQVSVAAVVVMALLGAVFLHGSEF